MEANVNVFADAVTSKSSTNKGEVMAKQIFAELPSMHSNSSEPFTDHLNPQRESKLVGLPLEIKLIIWQYILDARSLDGLIHLGMKEHQLIFVPCTQPPREPPAHFPRHSCLLGYWRRDQVNPLLLTCKLIYNEASDVFFRTSVFHFDRPEDLACLPHEMSLMRLQAIRHISLDMCISFSPLPASASKEEVQKDTDLHWQPACKVLASLTGLQNLHINVSARAMDFGYSFMPYDWAKRVYDLLFEPLRAIRARDFKVIAPVEEEIVRELGPYPFTYEQGNMIYPESDDDIGCDFGLDW